MATAKPAAKKTAAKTATKTTAKAATATADKPQASGFMKPMTPSTHLAAVIGSAPLPRTEVTKKIWAYIKEQKLQDAKDKKMINADAKLKPIFQKDQVSMFEMTKLVNGHLS
jgi:upstream activation factor subunit UAF30